MYVLPAVSSYQLWSNTMQQHLIVNGMTCGNCVAGVQRRFESVAGVTSAAVSLPNTAVVEIQDGSTVEISQLRDTLIGSKFSVEFGRPSPFAFLQTFAPLIMMFGVVLVWATVLTFPIGHHWQHDWMRHFMGGFFLLFGMLKAVNLKNFAAMYRGYDLLAVRIPVWGYVYPFVELALGVLYTFDAYATQTNIATAVIMTFGAIGITQKLQRGSNQTCACLGGFFSVPLTWVTVAENMLMAAMAVFMLFFH